MKKLMILVLAVLAVSIGKAQSVSEQSNSFVASNSTSAKVVRDYYENGFTKTEVTMLNGKPEGKMQTFFQDGQLNELRFYKNGMFDGTWITYNERGVKVAEASFMNNQKHGKWTIWDDDGTKRCEMFFENGKKTGTWWTWDEKGKLISEKEQ